MARVYSSPINLSFSRGQEVMHYIYVPIVYIFSGVVYRAHHAASRIEWFPGIFVLGPSDSQELLSFRFLSTVSSAVSIEALKQVSQFPTK